MSDSPAVTIGEETRFTGRAVAALVAALVFAAGVGLGIYQRLDGIETRLAVVETKVSDLAARTEHADRNARAPDAAEASIP